MNVGVCVCARARARVRGDLYVLRTSMCERVYVYNALPESEAARVGTCIVSFVFRTKSAEKNWNSELD
jgi:hypothetical protein